MKNRLLERSSRLSLELSPNNSGLLTSGEGGTPFEESEVNYTGVVLTEEHDPLDEGTEKQKSPGMQSNFRSFRTFFSFKFNESIN